MSSAVKPLINRENFSTITRLFFHGIFSFSCEKTTMKISGPVNELFLKASSILKETLFCSGGFESVSCLFL